MNEPEGKQQPDAASTERKPYEAPRIEESARFEHLVLTCSRTMGGGLECIDATARSIQ